MNTSGPRASTAKGQDLDVGFILTQANWHEQSGRKDWAYAIREAVAHVLYRVQTNQPDKYLELAGSAPDLEAPVQSDDESPLKMLARYAFGAGMRVQASRINTDNRTPWTGFGEWWDSEQARSRVAQCSAGAFEASADEPQSGDECATCGKQYTRLPQGDGLQVHERLFGHKFKPRATHETVERFDQGTGEWETHVVPRAAESEPRVTLEQVREAVRDIIGSYEGACFQGMCTDCREHLVRDVATALQTTMRSSIEETT